jgi:2-methylisocitrate lyase-like PEP mutase family enzyme
MAGPGAPTVPEHAALGVARVSLGSAVAEAAYGLVRRAAEELAKSGTYTAVEGGIPYPEINGLMG